MHRRPQFDMRENPASIRRHGSRLTAGSTENENSIKEENPAQPVSSPGYDHPPDGSDAYNISGSTRSGFEPLIGSLEAATLLGKIHVKTLQRYARHGRVPGYQIGGHWYFRMSDLDAWLRSRINSKSQSVR